MENNTNTCNNNNDKEKIYKDSSSSNISISSNNNIEMLNPKVNENLISFLSYENKNKNTYELYDIECDENVFVEFFLNRCINIIKKNTLN